MTYKAECQQTKCEFVERADTEHEGIEAIEHHTSEKHADIDLIDEDIRESITHVSEAPIARLCRKQTDDNTHRLESSISIHCRFPKIDKLLPKVT